MSGIRAPLFAVVTLLLPGLAGAAEAPAYSGFKIGSKEEGFLLRFSPHFQAQGRFFLDDPKHERLSTFLLRRVRPTLEGTVFGDFNFRIMPEFGQGKAGIEDAYLELVALGFLSPRAGKFRVPFGMERLQSSTHLTFVEYSLVSVLVPNRDVGAMVFGSLIDGAVAYQAGIFNGTPDGQSGDLDIDNSKDYFGRILVLPFRPTPIELLRDITLGFAYNGGVRRGSGKDTGLATYKTPGQQTLFAFNADRTLAPVVFADGTVQRMSPQATAYIGPVGLMAEYVLENEEVSTSTGRRTLHNKAWEVTASVFVTGQKASYKETRVDVPANLKKGQFGAIELAVRYDTLLLDRGVLDANVAAAGSRFRGARAYWAGFNWYLNDAVKLTGDYILAEFLKEGPFDEHETREHTIVAQAQLAL